MNEQYITEQYSVLSIVLLEKTWNAQCVSFHFTDRSLQRED